MSVSPEELPELTSTQLDVLRRYAAFEVNLEEVLAQLAGLFEFNFSSSSSHFLVPESRFRKGTASAVPTMLQFVAALAAEVRAKVGIICGANETTNCLRIRATQAGE